MTEILHKQLDWKELSSLLLPRAHDAHKNDFGHVLIIGGDFGMPGAVRLAAEAALRVGAGLVSVATRVKHIDIVCATRPEIMCCGVENSEDLLPLLKKATVVVVGPGLGKSEWSRILFHEVLKTSQPKIIDADALNLLAELSQKQTDWILTPHAGEAARLLNYETKEIQANRFNSANLLAKKYGGVVVLKGFGTLVYAENETPGICNAGNPGMATAGMGDVLSGVLGGLVAQKLSLFSAAKLGVLLHAMAGDMAAKENGERGMLASDLMAHLRKLVNMWGSGAAYDHADL